MTTPVLNDADRQQLVNVFIVEAEEILSALEELVLRLEHAPHDQELLHEIFRSAHTLKGNASCLRFDELTGFAHSLEAMLERLRSGDLQVTAVRVSQLLDAIDVLRDLAVRSVAGDCVLTSRQQALLHDLADAVTNTASGAGSQPAAGLAATQVTSLRVGIEKLDRMLDLTGEMAIARGHMRELLSGDSDRETLLDAMRELDALSLDLQEMVMSARLVAVGPVLRRFHRAVRDVAAAAGKRVSLVIEGDDVEVDTTAMENLKDPITHMIRNAIDHGIERPEERAACGKPPVGVIRIVAAHESGGVVFRFSDDGRGLDEQKIAARARSLSIDADRLSREEVLGLIFKPGFSTASEITEVSGRGVGMDVVRRNVEMLRGTLSISSTPGRGTTMTIRLPLTVALIEGFGVGVSGETYLIPIDAIAECMDLPAGTAADPCGVINVRGEVLPFIRLAHLFGSPAGEAARENVVVLHHEKGRAGIVVHDLLGGTQTVMKPLGPLLRGVQGVAGFSILGNGRVALILDPHEILRCAAEWTARPNEGDIPCSSGNV